MAAQLFFLPFQVVAKATNVGAPGALAYFYAPGTTTLRSVYADSSLTTQLSNPVEADGAGRLPNIYLDDTLTYRLYVTDRNGAELASIDPFTPGEIVVASSSADSFDVSGALTAGTITSTGAASLGPTTVDSLLSDTNGIGYTVGAGGAVTQATSKATGVTLNEACGQITLNGAALAADTVVSFTLTNSQIAAGDILVLNHVSGGTAGAYALNAQCVAGSASINVRNLTAGSLSEAPVIGFAVIKAVTT